MEALGYPVGRDAGGWVPHDLRRLGIDLLYAAGADERIAMEFVGHHTAAVHAGYLRGNAGAMAAIAEKTTAHILDTKNTALTDESNPFTPPFPSTKTKT